MEGPVRGRGRPPKDPTARRKARITFNLTGAQRAAIVRRAAREGSSLSDYALRACLRRPPARLVPAVNRATFENLHRIGANLNQWMHAINANQLPNSHLPDLRALHVLLLEVRAELKARPGERYVTEAGG